MSGRFVTGRRGGALAALALGALASLAAAVPPPEEPGRLSQVYDLYAGGIPIGEAVLEAEIGADGYRAGGTLRTAALVRAFFDAGMTVAAEGAIEGDAMRPDWFTVTTVNGDEVETRRIDYAAGAVEAVRTEPPENPRPWSLEPAGQGAVADPVTAALGTLAPRRSGFCGHRVEMFDGKRRFALKIGPAEPDGDRLRCPARYVRLGGYKPKFMAPDRRTMPFTLWFEPRADGRHRLVRALIPAGWIDLSLVRRD
ncbi:MAG TPA: DUF3108 domain-containing protein [Thermohalobaculum sp.]|nr:DUF3108 domain-containing protein [Thermohalobaculum sp.]